MVTLLQLSEKKRDDYKICILVCFFIGLIPPPQVSAHFDQEKHGGSADQSRGWTRKFTPYPCISLETEIYFSSFSLQRDKSSIYRFVFQTENREIWATQPSWTFCSAIVGWFGWSVLTVILLQFGPFLTGPYLFAPRPRPLILLTSYPVYFRALRGC